MTVQNFRYVRHAPQKVSIKREMLLRRSVKCKRVRYNKKSAVFSHSRRRPTNLTYESYAMSPNTLI